MKKILPTNTKKPKSHNKRSHIETSDLGKQKARTTLRSQASTTS